MITVFARRAGLQHIYMSIFYTSLYRYPRTDRLTVTFSILFGSMCGTRLAPMGCSRKAIGSNLMHSIS